MSSCKEIRAKLILIISISSAPKAPKKRNTVTFFLDEEQRFPHQRSKEGLEIDQVIIQDKANPRLHLSSILKAFIGVKTRSKKKVWS